MRRLVLLALLPPLLTSPAQAETRKPALELLSTLSVRAENADGYSRHKFEHWTTKHGSCNTREVVLIAESRRKVTKRSDCSVVKGRWKSPYDGRIHTTPARLDIDHRVALAEAWRSGANSWTRLRRQAFANDTGYGAALVAVTRNVNGAKSDSDPAQWEPARARCRYAALWVAVKYRWNLSVDVGEHTALTSRLTACGESRSTVVVPAKGKEGAGDGTPVPVVGTPTGQSVPPVSEWDCPVRAPIKGNADSMIYHVPDGAYYDITKPEECFSTEADAVAAGYRRSKA